MIIKNKEELEILREGGKILRTVLDEVENIIKPGVSTQELNEKALEVMKYFKVEPSFLNYKPSGHSRPYPAAICTSVNEEVVHGIPNENPRILKEGDLITIDSGVWFKDLCTDSARTVAVGKIDSKKQRLIDAAKEARSAQIKKAKVGVRVYELGGVVENVVEKYGYFSPEILGGHGVGEHVHEEPFIPNYAFENMTQKLREGEVLAFEPIIIESTPYVVLKEDGYTYESKDGSLSTQFEHTIVVWEDGAEILT